jgi:hypothetical protein
VGGHGGDVSAVGHGGFTYTSTLTRTRECQQVLRGTTKANDASFKKKTENCAFFYEENMLKKKGGDG